MIYKRNSSADEAVLDVAKRMVAAAVTAPKGHGIDISWLLSLTARTRTDFLPL